NFREWWEMNVDIQDLKNAYSRTHQNTTWNWKNVQDETNGLVPIYWNNPYYDRYESYETDGRSRYFGNVYLNYKPTEYLNFLGRVSLDNYSELQQERYAVGSVGVPYYSRFNHTFQEYNYDFLANFDKNISNDFNLKALIGTNLRQDLDNSIYGITNGGLVLPHLFTLSNSINTPNAPYERYTNIQVGGVFAGATLSWRKMLTLDGTVRRDQSSTLPAGHNSYYYPAVSGSFVFSELLKSQNWLSYGKIRANYATVGHSANAYGVYDTYNLNPPFGTNAVASATATKNNIGLVPEKNRSYEFGVEASVLQSRLGFDVTYYHALTYNQIMPVQISDATGYDARWLNAGSIQNQGFEVSVNGTPVKTHNFSWDITVNWTRNRNKVVALYDTATNLQIAAFQGNVTLNATKGQPYGTIRGNDFIYTNGQRTVSNDPNNNPGYYETTSTSNNVIGNANPDWLGSITNTFRYKNWTLNFLIDARKGGQLFSLDMYYGLATGLYPETAGKNDLGNPVRNSIANGGGIIYKGVTPDGKANTQRVDISDLFGAYGYLRNPAKAFVYDAGFVKLREAALSYSLPAKVVGKLGQNVFKGIDVSVIGRNLWIIHKNLPYADPEEIVTSGNAALGYQVGAYPTARTFAFNLKLRF
ncbi:MAG TPA: TonB-dependent receptor, partial [Puia sp.]|nr:TonB-dependent receptor [Puia sp.]